MMSTRLPVTNRRSRRRSSAAVAVTAVLASALLARSADASCNIIGEAPQRFVSALGIADRPFAQPNDFVTIGPDACRSVPPFPDDPSALVVTLLFTPPNGPHHVVVLAPTCPGTAVLDSCAAVASQAAGSASAICIPRNPLADEIGIVIGVDGIRRLRVKLPSPQVGSVPLAGPVTIAVTQANAALPCSLAAASCTSSLGLPGLLACVDDFFTDDGDCVRTAPHPNFRNFSFLPQANDFQRICTDPLCEPACTGAAPPQGCCCADVDEVRFTTDRAGNILLPINWRGVLLYDFEQGGTLGVPIETIVGGSSNVEAMEASQTPIVIPDASFVATFSPEGGLLHPTELAPTPNASALDVFGTAKAPYTVLRILRTGPGGPLFDFGTRFRNDVGPVVVSLVPPSRRQLGVRVAVGTSDCVASPCFAASVEGAQPLENLLASSTAAATLVKEAVVGRDLNGNGTATDTVVTFQERATGGTIAIGDGGTAARNIRLVASPPFVLPAYALEGGILAFLEPEAIDANDDFDAADDILRLFDVADGDLLVTITGWSNRAVDSSPRVNRRSLAVVDGRVHFRTSETAMARSADPVFNASIDATFFPDGALDDTVLEVIDVGAGSVTTLCPAEDVAVSSAGGAFLRPEAPSGGTVACPAGDLNGDADTSDLVVHRFTGSGPAENLGRAGVAVAVSPSWIGALVPEAGQGGTDLNGDGDAVDDVVQAHRTSGPVAWVNTGLAAGPADSTTGAFVRGFDVGDTVVGTRFVLLTPEAAQGDAPLNGDGDTSDHVLRLFDPAALTTTAIGQAAEDFVLGDEVVAFRTNEAAQGGGSLNAADGDTADDVLQAYDLVTATLVSSGATVRPNRCASCDPARPYRTFGALVAFLAAESDEGVDLDGDGTVDDVVSRLWDVRANRIETIATVDPDSSNDPLAQPPVDGGQRLISPAGRCVLLGSACAAGCPAGGFCEPRLGDVCVLFQPGTCRPGDPGACPPGSTCLDDLVAIASPDSDGDRIPDEIDNCPFVANFVQDDADADLVGDACDLATCGNGIQEPSEGCDDGNTTSDDGCSAHCQLERHFACYKAQQTSPPFVSRAVTLADPFESKEMIVAKPASLCTPVGTSGQGILEPTGHLTCYRLKHAGPRPPLLPATVGLSTEFGPGTAMVARPRVLCLPSARDGTPLALPLDHVKCYRAKLPGFEKRVIDVTNPFEAKNVVVQGRAQLCNPASKDGGGVLNPSGRLLCHRIRDVPGQPPFAPRDVVVDNQFGTATLTISAARELCVPAVVN
jgi:cysteine-rich repeat protein